LNNLELSQQRGAEALSENWQLGDCHETMATVCGKDEKPLFQIKTTMFGPCPQTLAEAIISKHNEGS